MKTIRTTIQVIGMSFVIFVSGFVGWIIRDIFPPSRAGISSASITRPAHILSIMEIQQQLVQLGYDIPVDGKLSPDWRHSQTQQAWELAINNQFAEKYMTESGRPK